LLGRNVALFSLPEVFCGPQIMPKMRWADGVPPLTPLGELSTLPKPLSRLGRGTSPIPLPQRLRCSASVTPIVKSWLRTCQRCYVLLLVVLHVCHENTRNNGLDVGVGLDLVPVGIFLPFVNSGMKSIISGNCTVIGKSTGNAGMRFIHSFHECYSSRSWVLRSKHVAVIAIQLQMSSLVTVIYTVHQRGTSHMLVTSHVFNVVITADYSKRDQHVDCSSTIVWIVRRWCPVAETVKADVLTVQQRWPGGGKTAVAELVAWSLDQARSIVSRPQRTAASGHQTRSWALQ